MSKDYSKAFDSMMGMDDKTKRFIGFEDEPRQEYRQVGGTHYEIMAFQPVDYIIANNLGFIEGSIIKYISRWQSKGGVEDLKKAKHYIEILIERNE